MDINFFIQLFYFYTNTAIVIIVLNTVFVFAHNSKGYSVKDRLKGAFYMGAIWPWEAILLIVIFVKAMYEEILELFYANKK